MGYVKLAVIFETIAIHVQERKAIIDFIRQIMFKKKFRLGQHYVTGVQGGFCGSMIILISNYTHAELIHLPFSSIHCMRELPLNDPSSPPLITTWFSITVHAIPERQDLWAYFVGSTSIDRSLLFNISVGSRSCSCMVEGKREKGMRCFRVKYGG